LSRGEKRECSQERCAGREGLRKMTESPKKRPTFEKGRESWFFVQQRERLRRRKGGMEVQRNLCGAGKMLLAKGLHEKEGRR